MLGFELAKASQEGIVPVGFGSLQVRFLLKINILAALSDFIYELEPRLDCSLFRTGKHTSHRTAKHLRTQRLPIQYKLTEAFQLESVFSLCFQILTSRYRERSRPFGRLLS